MPDRLLVRGARQLVTLRGPSGPRRGAALRELGIVTDGAVLISDGVILEAGSTRRIENLAAARQAREIDASGRVVLPGLVDCLAHPVSAPPQLGGRLEHEARRVLAAMARHGTTTVEARTGAFPDELKTLRVAARLNGAPLDVVRTHAAERFDAEQLACVGRRKLAEFVDLSPGDGVMPYLEQARRLGLQVRVRGSAALARESGAVSVSGLDGDAEPLARSNAIAVLTPGPAFYGGAPRPPARAWADLGVALAVATGYHPELSPSPSLPAAVSLACIELGLTPAEAICAATINAAHALGRASSRGSIEYFKDGDLVLLNASDYRELPSRFGCNLVHMTIKRGAIIYQEGSVA